MAAPFAITDDEDTSLLLNLGREETTKVTVAQCPLEIDTVDARPSGRLILDVGRKTSNLTDQQC